VLTKIIKVLNTKSLFTTPKTGRGRNHAAAEIAIALELSWFGGKPVNINYNLCNENSDVKGKSFCN
jgi:hypothetical protein